MQNAGILNGVKAAMCKDYMEGLKALDQELVKTAVTGERFQTGFFEYAQDQELKDYVKGLLDS